MCIYIYTKQHEQSSPTPCQNLKISFKFRNLVESIVFEIYNNNQLRHSRKPLFLSHKKSVIFGSQDA